MNKFLNFGKSLWKDESGATAIEYGLLAALISVAIILAVTTLGQTLNGVFGDVNDKMDPTGTYAVADPVRRSDRSHLLKPEPVAACVSSLSSLRR